MEGPMIAAILFIAIGGGGAWLFFWWQLRKQKQGQR